MTYITPKLFELVRNENTKISERVYDNVLQRDKVNIVLDDDVFWIEQVSRYAPIPDYAYKYIIRLLEREGYRYLFNIKTNL